MKTSNYIAISFLIFLFGSLTVLHIDSKLYEDEYKEQIATRKNNTKVFERLRSLRRDLDKYSNDINKWNEILKFHDSLIDNNRVLIPWEISFFVGKYKNFESQRGLELSKIWVERILSKNPNQIGSLYNHATILFETGETKKAITQLEKVIQLEKDKGRKTEYQQKQLERYKKHLDDKVLKVGDHFIDVTVTNLDKKEVKLTNIINNKVTLINFWHPRGFISKVNNRKLFPLYYEYKHKGLNAVSLIEAREINDKLKQTVENENNPWTNLVDLNKENRIWDRYGILNTYSRNLLIDKNGIIIAIDPTENELREILNKLL